MAAGKQLGEIRRTVRRTITAVLFTALFAHPAAAQASPNDCEPPAEFDPLLGLLDSLTQLAFLGGVGLATLGFTVAGIFIIIPGQDNTRKGKDIAKNVLYGTVLLLSAHMVVGFLTSQLNTGVFC